MSRPLRVAFLVVDDRGDGERPAPFFGTAPAALLDGFAGLGREVVEVHVVSCLSRPMPCPDKLADNIWFHGESVPPWGYLRTGYSGCVGAVRRMVARIRPDIVHAQGSERWCAVAGAFLPCPKILTLHGVLERIVPMKLMSGSWFWRLQRMGERFSVPRYDGVVCLSHHAQGAVQKRARRTWLIPNAVDAGLLQADRKPCLPLRLLCLASVMPLKNQVALIEALAPLAAERSLELRFAGQCDPADPYGARFLDAVSRHPWCRHVGWIDRGQLRRELEAATALVVASQEENCPMCVLEAMAAGVPVVAVDVGGVRDLLADGMAGILVAGTADLDPALRRMLDDPAAAARLGRQGQDRIRRLHLPHQVAAAHLAAYTEVRSVGATIAG